MRCEEFQTLIEAHLEGGLAGSLRLEFDAHRISCPACEHAVTLLEVVTSVIAAPTKAPEPSSDFTEKVMAQIAAPAVIRHPAASRRHAGLRAVLVAGALVQAAAVWMLAVIPQHPDRIPISMPPEQIDLERTSPAALSRYLAEMAVHRAQVAGNLVKVSEIQQFAMNLNVGESVALDPVGLLQAWLPVQPAMPSAQPSMQAGNQFSF